MQTTSKILMVRPYRFAFNKETAGNNFFQRDAGSNPDMQDAVAERALQEFDAIVALLQRNDVDVTVVQDTPEPWTPDSLFPNNWFSSHTTGELVLYPMFAENRRMERKREVLDLLRRKMNHRKVVDLTHWEEEGEFLEGTGSMVFDRRRRIAYCCRSARTSEKVLADFCSKMSFDPIVFDAVDTEGHPLYHTNIMMEIGMQVAVVCLESITEESHRKRVAAELISAGKVIVEISLDQLARFTGNMLEVKSRNGQPFMVMSASARDSLTIPQERVISTYNKILSVDLETIETYGGGSARCMLGEIFH